MPKLGSYSAVSHTEFQLIPMQSDRRRIDYGSGGGKIGTNVVFHLS